MRVKHLKFLCCPECGESLSLDPDNMMESDRVKEGLLQCRNQHSFPVKSFIPRFVSSDNYAQSFGFQWLKHARTQYDSYTGKPLSKRRFFATTGWPENLEGKLILEAGCGSGRFTEIAAQTGGMVLSFDYSAAVEANYASNGLRDNVLIVQANIYTMPFPRGSVDYLFCLGVLQHTPDVERSFKVLTEYLKPGGQIAVDIYLEMTGLLSWILRTSSTANLVRPITSRMKSERLYEFCENHINRMWWLTKKICEKKWGPFVLRRLLVPPYIGVYDLPEETLKQWIKLDLFDALSARYIYCQNMETAKKWFAECKLEHVEVFDGYNGINGRGTKS